MGALAFLLLLGSASGQEPDDDERARRHFQSGESYFAEGDYEQAYEEFERAYALSHREELLFNLALCAERLGEFDEAASHLRRYLETGQDIANRELVETRLRNLEERAQRARRDERVEEEEAFPVGPVVLYGAAAVGLALFGVFGALTLAEDSDIATNGCGLTSTCSDGDLAALHGYALAADISLGAGLAFAVAATIWLLAGGGDATDTAFGPSAFAARF